MDDRFILKRHLRQLADRVVQKIKLVDEKTDDISEDITSLQTQVNEISIPTKVSQLSNDSGFQTSSQVSSAITTAVNGISIPTKLSELTNDSGYLKTINGISANGAGEIKLSPPDLGSASNLNLLDNVYWACKDVIINQRALTEYINTSGGNYTIDRWYMVGVNNMMQLNVLNDCIHVKNNASSDGGLVQLLESNGLKGKQLTLSFIVKSGEGVILLRNANYQTFVSKAFSLPGVYSTTEVIPENTTDVIIAEILLKQGKECSLVAGKLELGDKQTLAHKDADGNWVLNDPPPNKALELAKCQRYYNRLKLNSYLHVSSSTNTYELCIQYPTMRIAPSVTFISSHDSVSAINVSTNGFSVRSSQAGSYVGTVELDAELD